MANPRVWLMPYHGTSWRNGRQAQIIIINSPAGGVGPPWSLQNMMIMSKMRILKIRDILGAPKTIPGLKRESRAGRDGYSPGICVVSWVER